MAKLTKEQFENRQATDADVSAASEKEQAALVKKAFDWQEKNDIYAWDAEELQAGAEILLVSGLFVLEANGVQAAFYREPDMPENEGKCGQYLLRQLDENFWHLEKLAQEEAEKGENQ